MRAHGNWGWDGTENRRRNRFADVRVGPPNREILASRSWDDVLEVLGRQPDAEMFKMNDLARAEGIPMYVKAK